MNKKIKVLIGILATIIIVESGLLVYMGIKINKNSNKLVNGINEVSAAQNYLTEENLSNNIQNINETNNDNITNENSTIIKNEVNANVKNEISTVVKNEVNTIAKNEVIEGNKNNINVNTTTKNDVTHSEQTNQNKKNKTIVIDPGHQVKGNSEKEPIGPGATQTKAKVTTGATGVSTKQTESELNLKVSLLLQKELTKRGYTVIMTRTTNNVNMSNSERAKIANNANADAFIRIHANSSENSSAKGVLTMCQTANNPYNGNLAQNSYNLSKLVVDNIAKTTGANNRSVTRTDTMSGINWCTVPTTIVEMGFLSNPEEDKLMATEEYQKKIVQGIVNGLEEYFK